MSIVSLQSGSSCKIYAKKDIPGSKLIGLSQRQQTLGGSHSNRQSHSPVCGHQTTRVVKSMSDFDVTETIDLQRLSMNLTQPS